MRYLSHYEDVPKFIPAEGGYYATATVLINSVKLSHRQAKRKMEQLIQNALDNGEKFHVRTDDRYALYIFEPCTGERDFYIIERHKGSQEYDPIYC